MHISEGVLSLGVLAGGGALATVAVGIGLRRLPESRIPLAGLLCALFFVTSLIHIPVGITAVHLVLNGVCGIMLGWGAFPVIAIALLLQALLFGFGGLTTLGVNILVMGTPALVCYTLFYAATTARPITASQAMWRGAICGMCGIALGVMLMASVLWLSGGRSFLPLVWAVMLTHIPVLLIEACLTAALVSTLLRTQPALLKPLEQA